MSATLNIGRQSSIWDRVRCRAKKTSAALWKKWKKQPLSNTYPATLSGKGVVVFDVWAGALFFQLPALKFRISSCGQCWSQRRNNNDWLLPAYTCAPTELLADMEVSTSPFFYLHIFGNYVAVGRICQTLLMLSKEAVIEHKDCVKWQAFCEWQELQVLSLASDTMCHTVPHPHKTDQAQQSFDPVQGTCRCQRLRVVSVLGST